MSDERFIDLDSIEGHAELLRRARQAITDIGTVEAACRDDLVRVGVTVSGFVTHVILGEGTSQLGRAELGHLITMTAQQAAQLAAAKAASAMEELRREQVRLVEQMETVDSSAAEALRTITASTTIDESLAFDPLDDFFSPVHPPAGDEHHDEW
jgi:hypothetical protein